MAEPQRIEGIYKAVGSRFREIRTSRALTQADVAAEAGLTRQSVANIERGRQRFMLHTLFDVARALGMSAKELLPSEGGTSVTAALQRDLQRVESSAGREFAESILQQNSTKP